LIVKTHVRATPKQTELLFSVWFLEVLTVNSPKNRKLLLP
jgi:hypothetical protein